MHCRLYIPLKIRSLQAIRMVQLMRMITSVTKAIRRCTMNYESGEGYKKEHDTMCRCRHAGASNILGQRGTEETKMFQELFHHVGTEYTIMVG